MYNQAQNPFGSVGLSTTVTDAFIDEALCQAEALEHRSSPVASDFPWGKPVATNRGCLMARPGTKGVLMLLSLIAEEEALMETHLGRPVESKDFKVHPNTQDLKTPWRCFTAAGDDHAAIGLKKYLSKIGTNHEKNRMVISKEKHGISRRLAKFTEEWFVKLDRTTYTGKPKSYEDDPFVDTVKMRLVGPETKPSQGSGSVNPAIGKGPMLFKRMAWAPESHRTFFNTVGRARFFARNRHYLPKGELGNYDRKVELPSELGGLSLGPPSNWKQWNVSDVLKSVSDEHAFGIRHAIENESSTIRPILSRFSADRFARGTPLSSLEGESKFSIPDFIPTYSTEQIRTNFLENGYIHELSGIRQVYKHAHKNGFMTEADLNNLIKRSEIQIYLMTNTPKNEFAPAPWQDRYITMDNCIREERIQLGLQGKPDDRTVVEAYLKKFRHINQFRKEFHKEARWYQLDEVCIITPDGGMLDLKESLSFMLVSLDLPPTVGAEDISETSTSFYSLDDFSHHRVAGDTAAN